MLGLFLANSAWATDDFVFTINSLSEFEAGQYPFVSGNAFTLDKTPVSDVQIQVNFPSEKIKTSTNSTGQFYVTSMIPAEIGEYTITVYAKKDNRFTDAQIIYQVSESLPTKQLKITNPIEQIPKVTDGNVELDPFSKMIKQLEEQKEIEVKKKEIAKEQQQINEQRIQAEAELQKDLKDSEKRMEYYSPRNVFYRFIQEVDSSFRGIFWQQFLFTEKITKEAHDAKENALDEGKSSLDAMKIFQEKAKVTQNEIMGLNKNLNIQYGNATSYTQDQFNEKGKIPREE
ncbi:hypothetical protein C5F50_05280 [Nitrosopumilus ureiphilus]|uniref:Carboxypeptidase regulatory-like domain-containing protein n=2 Tax=Nitrosopumilus ureiphilus TaxID=1470067 RepID=A0A7D5RAK5_9ARCH|nr:hypothetical protein C5F50_05280 [Nitrosopumilus ureiphilus]